MQESNIIGAVQNATIDIFESEIFVIMGLSGSGKSTLMRCLSRLIESTYGQIYFENSDLMKMSNKDQKFFSFYYYFLMFKFLVSTPITYIYMNKIIKSINPMLLIFKYTMDLYIVSFIAAIFLVFLIRSLNIQKIK